MEKLQLMHKEINEKGFEIFKSTIAEDKQRKRWTIDKDALLQNLPEPFS